MALGRQGERQADLMIGWAELPRSPGHAFYDRLQAVLIAAGFDGFAEKHCAPYYASKRGRPSLPPGRYFRMHLVGYFEGIDSERGLEWRCADSLSLREFLRLGTTERENLRKRYLVHVAGYNLGLILRLLVGAGTPREFVAGAAAHLLALATADGATLVILTVATGTEAAMLVVSFRPEPSD